MLPILKRDSFQDPAKLETPVVEPQSVKSAKNSKQDATPKSAKVKGSKKKKKKGKKGKKEKKKKKKAVSSTPAVEQIQVATQAFSQSPEVASLNLNVVSQEVDYQKVQHEQEEPEMNETNSNPFRRQNAIVEETSESEYFSEAESSEEQPDTAEPVLTPSHAIQEKISYVIGEDPLIVQLPKYSLTREISRVFRQQNGKPTPEFVTLTDRGIFIQSDEFKNKGRYFLELITSVTHGGQQFADTQYFTLVVCDTLQQSVNSVSLKAEIFEQDNQKSEKINGRDRPNSQLNTLKQESLQDEGDENIWDQKFQSEVTSLKHFNSQPIDIQTRNDDQGSPKSIKSREKSNSKAMQKSVEKNSSPPHRKSRTNSEAEVKTLLLNQKAVASQFQSLPRVEEHFKTQKTDEDSQLVSRQQASLDSQQQYAVQPMEKRQSILRLPKPKSSGGLLADINETPSHGLVEQTEVQSEESWEEDNEGASDGQSENSQTSPSRPMQHPQTQKNASLAKLSQIEEGKTSFSKLTTPYQTGKPADAAKLKSGRKSEVVTGTAKLNQQLELFQNLPKARQSQRISPQKSQHAPNFTTTPSKVRHEREDVQPEIRNIQIQSSQPKQERLKETKAATLEVETDKFISFSANQSRILHFDPSPNNRETQQRRQSKSPVNQQQNSDVKRTSNAQPPVTGTSIAFYSNRSIDKAHEGQGSYELSHQEKIKQRTERARDSQKGAYHKQQNPTQQVIPLQEQREHRRRSRGERNHQNPGSVSPLNLSALQNRYFQEGPKFTTLGFHNTQSLEGLKDYYNDNESSAQPSLQSTQQYEALMATLNSIRSESLKQSFQYAAELGHEDRATMPQALTDRDKQNFVRDHTTFGQLPKQSENKPSLTIDESSDINSNSTHNAELLAQSGGHNGKASLQKLIEYNHQKALRKNQKLRDKIQKVKVQMQIESGVLADEFTRNRMEETMGLFDYLHEKEESEINRQLRLQIETAQDNVRKMQGQLQKQEHERFCTIQATQLEAQKTLADEELLLKSYLYDAISQTQNLKLKCTFLGSEKQTLQEKVNLLLEQIAYADASIEKEESALQESLKEYEDGVQVIQQNQAILQPAQIEVKSLMSLNEALKSQVYDYRVELDAKLQDQNQVLKSCDRIKEKQQRLEQLIEKHTVTTNQLNSESELMSAEVLRVWALLQQESLRLQTIQKQIVQDQLESKNQQRTYQLDQQRDFLNQQRAAQIRAIQQAELEHQSWLLEMEYQKQKELLKLSQQKPSIQNTTYTPAQTQTQHLMYTPKRTNNRDNKSSVAVSQERSQHTPEPFRQVRQPDHQIFGGNDDLPDQMRYTTTYRQFAGSSNSAVRKENEFTAEDTFNKSEARFTRFGTVWDRQEKTPQRSNLSASRERLVNEGQDMAMLLRPGSTTPQNTFKFGVSKFLVSPVNKKMMAQLPKLRNELVILEEQKQIEKRTDRRVKLDEQIAFCENRITEIEKKISME